MLQKLTEQEGYDYINQYVLPAFQGMVTQDLLCTIYDWDGRVILGTTKSAQSIGLESWHDLRGYSYQTPNMEKAILFAKNKGLPLAQVLNDCQAIYELQQLVVKHKKPLKYLDLMPYNGEMLSYMVFLVPIFHPNGAVIAYQSITQEYMFYGIHDFLSTIQGSSSIKKAPASSALPSIKLAPRQREILFLISQGITQNIAAKILAIKRGSISKIISEQLCPKFAIDPPCTQILIKKAIALGFNKSIPNGLRRRHLIVLDSEAEPTSNDIYFHNSVG